MELDTPPEIIMCDDIDCNVQYQFPMDNIAFKGGLLKLPVVLPAHTEFRERL